MQGISISSDMVDARYRRPPETTSYWPGTAGTARTVMGLMRPLAFMLSASSRNSVSGNVLRGLVGDGKRSESRSISICTAAWGDSVAPRSAAFAFFVDVAIVVDVAGY